MAPPPTSEKRRPGGDRRSGRARAVALLAACAEESVHRPRRGAGGAETAAAARDRVDDVVFVLAPSRDGSRGVVRGRGAGASTMIVPPWTFPRMPKGLPPRRQPTLYAPLSAALPGAQRRRAAGLCWIPAGVALSKLATRRNGSLLAATLAAVFEEGDEAAAEAGSSRRRPAPNRGGRRRSSRAPAERCVGREPGRRGRLRRLVPPVRLAARRRRWALAGRAFAARPKEDRGRRARLLRDGARRPASRASRRVAARRAGGVLEARPDAADSR